VIRYAKLSLALLLLVGLSFSQIVEKIEVQGNKYLTEEMIKGMLLTKEGSTFSLEVIREDIRRLFRTGFFKRIEAHRFEEDGKVRVLYVVEDLPVIYSIEFEGNKKISTEELSNKLGIETEVGKMNVEELLTQYTSSPAIEERLEIQRRMRLGRILSPQEIESLVRRIKEIYRKEGYPDVEVSYEIVPKRGASKLLFHIKEGEEKYVVNVVFKGNETFSDSKLKDLMKTKDRRLLLLRWKPPFSEDVLDEDVERIKEFYKEEGFLEVKVEKRVEKKDGRHDIYILIEEGPRYKLKELRIEGNTLYAYSEIVGKLIERNESKGGFYRAEVVEKIKKNIRDLYGEIGFANVLVEEEKRVDTQRKEVSLTLKVREGKPVYVSRIKIEGNYETRDYVVRREMRVQEQELSINMGIRRSRTRILGLGYYEDVQIQPIPTDDSWDLLVRIRERFTGQFSVGIAYNEVTKLSGFVSLRKGNFLGTGDIVGLSLSYGSKYRDNSISYTDKWFLDKPVDLTWSLFNRRIEYTTYTVERQGGSAAFSKEFWEYWNWSLGLSAERVRYSNIDPNASALVREQEGVRESRKLTFSILRDTRDYFLFPTEGSYVSLSYTVAVPVLGGSERFHRFVLTGSKFIKDTYFDTGLVFASKGTLGLVEPYGGNKVPLDERFFVGGDFTIRGYEYGKAGVLDNNGDPIGSKKELVLNFELNYKIHEVLYGGIFYDTGLGADNWKDFDPKNWRGGYGVGIRFVTPIAPIRLDFAWKTKKVPGDTGRSRFHFVIGSFF